MNDEIRKDDSFEDMHEMEKKFNKMIEDGTLRSCPNLHDLPMEEKERISKGALMHALELLMKTYLSLGLCGEAVLGAKDGFTGNKYKLIFKAMKDGDPDDHFDRDGR
jgi:hypothetical protein